MKKQNKLKGIVTWTFSALGVSLISLIVWKAWPALSLLPRKIYQLRLIKISIGYFVIFCLVAFLIWYFISRSVKRKKERQSDWTGVGSIPKYGYEEFGTRIYEGVKWLLLLPKRGTFDSHPLLPSPSPSEIAEKLKVEGPLCPECDTELEENKRFRWYILTCVKCDFHIRKKDPIYKLREKVYRLSQPDIREHLQKQMKKGS